MDYFDDEHRILVKRVDTMLMLGDISVPSQARDARLLEQVDESQASLVIDGSHCDPRAVLQQLLLAKQRLEDKLRLLEASIADVRTKIHSAGLASPPSPSLRPEPHVAGGRGPSSGVKAQEKGLESDTSGGSDCAAQDLEHVSTRRKLSPLKSKNPENARSSEALPEPKKPGQPAEVTGRQCAARLSTASVRSFSEARHESLLESHLTDCKQHCDKQTQTDRLHPEQSRSPSLALPRKRKQRLSNKAKRKPPEASDRAIFKTADAGGPQCQPNLLREAAVKPDCNKQPRIVRLSLLQPAPANQWPLLRPPALLHRADRDGVCRRDTHTACVRNPKSLRLVGGSPGRAAQTRLQPVDWTANRTVVCSSQDRQPPRGAAPRSPRPKMVEPRAASPQQHYPRSTRTIDARQPTKSSQPVGRVARPARNQAAVLTAQRSSRLIYV